MPKSAENKKKTVFVAMSGGVDSSVAAALLVQKGYDVKGAFIKGWYPSGIPCGWRQDKRDAARVAAILNIPFHTFDFSKEYKKKIIDYMISSYKAGKTPNPDVMCNKHIKFDLFLKRAKENGADYIATGHYIRIKSEKTKSVNSAQGQKVVYRLFKAADKNKDQSYFLWTLTQKQLKYCLFPIGGYLKSEVRKMAKNFKLSNYDKKDSQGLCFVGEFKMGDFLKRYIKLRPGKIITTTGTVVGKHKGVQCYTIGQRHGFGRTDGGPHYVIGKDLKRNILIVADPKSEKKFFKREIRIIKVNWISDKAPSFSKSYSARVRYRQPLAKCRLKKANQGLLVAFSKPQRAIAPGQSLVLYDGRELLGGGIIA
jgi:tRNA-specific 2-thiouridylase